MPSRYTLRQTAELARFAANIARPRTSLLFLSHTRSFSSLLCHILNSNPEVDGYGELWIDYRSPLDLFNMRYQIALSTGGRLRGRYALDKVLHNKMVLDDAILTSASTRIMIGIREPEGTVRSIIATGRDKSAPAWKKTPKGACGHYTSRVKALAAVVEKRSDVLVFPTDALLSNSEEFLSGLGTWLGLDEPLSSNYEVGAMTGRPLFGDTSEEIKSGAIQPDHRQHDVEIPPALADGIWRAYDDAFDRLTADADRVLCAGSRVRRAAVMES